MCRLSALAGSIIALVLFIACSARAPSPSPTRASEPPTSQITSEPVQPVNPTTATPSVGLIATSVIDSKENAPPGGGTSISKLHWRTCRTNGKETARIWEPSCSRQRASLMTLF